MTASKSSKPATKTKPAKPYDEFPLFAHANGQWSKKIRGRLHYFGPWSNPNGALESYHAQKDDLHRGRKPRAKIDGYTIRDLCNRFLTSKQNLVDVGELALRTWDDYKRTTDLLVKAFGKTRLLYDLGSEDFETLRKKIAKTAGPTTLGNEINRIRVVCKFAYDEELVDRPIRYGQSFKRPSKKTLRRVRNERGPRMLEANQIRDLLETANRQMRAMILLGVNCGFGNNDVALLPISAVDLDGGWIDYPRPKTEINRRCPLWPETVEALREVISHRTEPKDESLAGRLFVTKRGESWAKETRDNPISKEMVKLLKALGYHRRGLAFYALRHTFETIGGESRDQVAVDHVMGHARDDMASVYRERISDERLRDVVDHVHSWLFP